MSQKHRRFSWWWAHSRPKHVEIDKYSKKNCAPSWLYLQDYTDMHGQQNIKKMATTNFLQSPYQDPQIPQDKMRLISS